MNKKQKYQESYTYMDDYLKMRAAYSERCEDCDSKGILVDGNFCSCDVGMAESYMGVSSEADKILGERGK